MVRSISSFVALLSIITVPASQACDLMIPKRQPTIAEQVAGLDKMFGGTVIGYVTEDGTQLMGPIPAHCRSDSYGIWWNEELPPECAVYMDTVAALFKVDVAIVGPDAGEVATYSMHWGDGDCDIDFEVGEKWLIAGFWYTQELNGPIRDSEVALLQRLAARPAFDFNTLYTLRR